MKHRLDQNESIIEYKSSPHDHNSQLVKDLIEINSNATLQDMSAIERV